MRKKGSLINLFHYTDYRAYLRDLYHEAKKSRGSFSFRAFSKRAGFASPNFLKLVMDGQRNLTEKSLIPFMVGLNLNKQEQDFFRNLVFFNQAKSVKERDIYYQQLIQSRKFNQLKPLEKNQYDYCSEWYHAVVRELVTSQAFDGTPEWVANRIVPAITTSQVERSIELLEKLGLITKTQEGSFQQSSSLISTGVEVNSIVLFNYHRNLLDLAKNALANLAASQRDISSLTLGITLQQIPVLKQKIQEFRQDILKFVSTETNPQEVVQLNMQLFPVTRSENKEPL